MSRALYVVDPRDGQVRINVEPRGDIWGLLRVRDDKWLSLYRDEIGVGLTHLSGDVDRWSTEQAAWDALASVLAPDLVGQAPA